MTLLGEADYQMLFPSWNPKHNSSFPIWAMEQTAFDQRRACGIGIIWAISPPPGRRNGRLP